MSSPESPEDAFLAFQESRRASDIIRIAETILEDSRAILREQGFEHFARALEPVQFKWDVLEFSFGIAKRYAREIKLSYSFFRTNFWKIEFRDAIYHLIAHIIAGEEHSDIWEYFALLIGGSGNPLLGIPLPLDDMRTAQVIYLESPEHRETQRIARLQHLQSMMEEEE